MGENSLTWSKWRFRFSKGPKTQLCYISAVYCPIMFKFCMQVAYCSPGKSCYITFPIKGQTKAAAAFKGNFGVYGPILFKFCMQVAYYSPRRPCYITFTIKGQTKAAAAFRGNFGVFEPILFKLCMQFSPYQPVSCCFYKSLFWGFTAKIREDSCSLCKSHVTYRPR